MTSALLSAACFRQWQPRNPIVSACWGPLPPFWAWYRVGKHTADPLYPRLQQALAQHTSVYDAGCGLAASADLCRPNATWIGMDGDRDKLACAATVVSGHQQLYVGDLRHLVNAPVQPVSAIVCADVLHYWPMEEQQIILAKLSAWAQPNTTLYLRTSLRDEDEGAQVLKAENRTTKVGIHALGAEHGLYHYDRLSLQHQLQQLGWKIQTQEPCGMGNVLFIAKQTSHPRCV